MRRVGQDIHPRSRAHSVVYDVYRDYIEYDGRDVCCNAHLDVRHDVVLPGDR
jgi:hypothetical protein